MADFHLLITDWYRQNARELPWRNTKNPYFIWLSEIILQQTRVDQGRDYYHKFTQNYPKIEDLAKADEQQILKDWQGLGYYSRARNLHSTAKFIQQDLNGVFPSTFEEIRSLKGIGDYTAAAISSFAFDLPFAVVDGNVFRVLSRYFDIDLPIDSSKGKKYFQELAQELLNSKNPGIHNQAIMEIGSLVCKPAHPDCTNCPLNSTCLALKHNTIQDRPVKEKKTKVRDRFFSFLIFKEDNKVIMEKRKDKDVWQHLYQFPLIETSEKLNPKSHDVFSGLKASKVSEELIHILSHQKIHARFYHFDGFPKDLQSTWITIQSTDFEELPLPRLIDRYLESNALF